MRGDNQINSSLFSYIDLEERGSGGSSAASDSGDRERGVGRAFVGPLLAPRSPARSARASWTAVFRRVLRLDALAAKRWISPSKFCPMTQPVDHS
jgi:hypothetical protein